MTHTFDVVARRMAAVAILVPSLALAMPGAGGAPPAAAPTTRADIKARLEVPLFDDRFSAFPVATIGEEVVTLAELRDALALAHTPHEVGATAQRKKDPRAIVERLIETRLLVAEARAMGIDELPELRASVAAFEEQALRGMVEEGATKDVRVDAFELERGYRAATIEWKQRSLLFTKRDAAQAAVEAVRSGKAFDEVVKAALADGAAKGGDPGQFTPADRMLPEVAAALRRTEKGAITDPIELDAGHTIVLVEDVRYREDPALKASMEQEALEALRRQTLERFADALVKKHAKIDQRLVKQLDYHASKQRFDALLEDKRVVARIAGEAPVTVAELTREIAKDFYHGLETALREKKINNKKEPKLEALLRRRVFATEARAQKIAASSEYQQRVAAWERNVVFGTFLQRVVAPNVKVAEEDARKYFEANAAAFTYPAIYRLDAIAFEQARDATAALAKLQAGTDFKWLKANAERQVPEDARVLDFSTPLAATGLPKPLAQSLDGARKGDYRLHADAGGQHYVVSVTDVTGPERQPFESAQERITQKLFGEGVTAALKEWAAKLRDVHQVKVYITLVE